MAKRKPNNNLDGARLTAAISANRVECNTLMAQYANAVSEKDGNRAARLGESLRTALALRNDLRYAQEVQGGDSDESRIDQLEVRVGNAAQLAIANADALIEQGERLDKLEGKRTADGVLV